MKRVIHIGDGKHIEIEEGALKKPPLPTVEKKPPPPYETPPGKRRNLRTKRILCETLPGYQEWLNLRHKQTKGLSPQVGRRYGQVPGLTREQTADLWVETRNKVKEDMANIEKLGLDLDTSAKDALETTLEIMRFPEGDTKTKLAAARQVLEWTMAKPVAKSEVTVNSAEQWLASIAKDDDGED